MSTCRRPTKAAFCKWWRWTPRSRFSSLGALALKLVASYCCLPMVDQQRLLVTGTAHSALEKSRFVDSLEGYTTFVEGHGSQSCESLLTRRMPSKKRAENCFMAHLVTGHQSKTPIPSGRTFSLAFLFLVPNRLSILFGAPPYGYQWYRSRGESLQNRKQKRRGRLAKMHGCQIFGSLK